MADAAPEFQAEVDKVGRIAAVPTILEVVCRTTGMGFAAVARVTESRWVACRVLDEIDFGLKPGGELPVETTICHEIRQTREAIVIEHVAEDSVWCNHATPAHYGFQSYISMPIILADGTFYGTLCAIDRHPRHIATPETTGMFRLFAELIAKHLDASVALAVSQSALIEERAEAELREQFIAVLGHDLRSPLRGIRSFAELLLRSPLDERALGFASFIRDSATRMQSLIDNLLDLARGRLGGGLSLARDAGASLQPLLESVIAEQKASFPGRVIETVIALTGSVNCDRQRVAQLFSNLLSNALTYGSEEDPVLVRILSDDAGVFELSVANGGKPIPAAALKRLFQPFYRNAVEQNREGLGLGLYISHEIARAHGGTLEVESNSEQTRFTFRMPAK